MTKHTGSWTHGKRKRCEATAYVFLSYIRIKSYQQNHNIENYFNADLIFRHHFLTLPGDEKTLQEESILLTQGFILIMLTNGCDNYNRGTLQTRVAKYNHNKKLNNYVARRLSVHL